MMCIYQAALKSSFPERLWLSERLSRFFSVFKDQFYTAVIPDLLKNTAGIHQLHTWEGMSGNQLFRETKLSSQHSHFIFVKVFQWFYYFTLKKKKKLKKQFTLQLTYPNKKPQIFMFWHPNWPDITGPVPRIP